MQVPLEITFRDVVKTPDVEELIRKQTDKLHKFCQYMISCRVTIERPQKFQRAGNRYRVRLDIAVPPGKEIVVAKDPLDNEMHDDLRTVILEAFKAARRQLDKVVELQRKDVKRHEEPVAFVTRIFPEANYGFLKTDDGRDIYFHRNSVADDDFDRLSIGTQVRFEESEGDEGPQASTVQIIDKLGTRFKPTGIDLPAPPLGWEAMGRTRAPNRKRASKIR